MPRNIEIKARISDRDTLIKRILALNPHHQEHLTQRDTFFNTPQGRLKLRQLSDGNAELIYYLRPDSSGPKLSEYSRCPVNAANNLTTTLARAYGVRGIVEKKRTVYLHGQTRIHIDQVHQLGDFMELEVVLERHQTIEEGQHIAQQLLASLAIQDDQLIETAYIDLLTPKSRK